jgi:hypothetical protein
MRHSILGEFEGRRGSLAGGPGFFVFGGALLQKIPGMI